MIIVSRDYWLKALENQQMNWSLVDDEGEGCVAYFFHELSGVFDRLHFASRAIAERALRHNGFERLADYPDDQIAVPPPPYYADDIGVVRSTRQVSSGVRRLTTADVMNRALVAFGQSQSLVSSSLCQRPD